MVQMDRGISENEAWQASRASAIHSLRVGGSTMSSSLTFFCSIRDVSFPSKKLDKAHRGSQNRMELKKIESKEDYLLVTLAGQVSFSEAVVVLIKVRTVATERGFDKVLVDCLSLRGELSNFERYELAQALARHWLNGLSGTPRIAIVGTPPTINGFGALVASNRGFLAGTFSELPKALDWLNRFD